jgi:mono/diheme cytochrome c family protein
MSLFLAAWLAQGCRSGDDQAVSRASAPPSAPAAPGSPPGNGAEKAEAQQIFQMRCVTCHGPSGAGDGPASTGLTPPPRNFHDPEWQKSVTDAHIEQIIRFGGAAVGRSPAMPGNPDLTSKPEVVIALREHVRSLAN